MLSGFGIRAADRARAYAETIELLVQNFFSSSIAIATIPGIVDLFVEFSQRFLMAHQ